MEEESTNRSTGKNDGSASLPANQGQGTPKGRQKTIATTRDLSECMGNVINQLLDGSLQPEVADAACRAAAVALKTAELEHRYKDGKALQLRSGN